MISRLASNETLSGLRAGDRQAFEEYFMFYYSRIFFFANTLVRDTGVADEITSETFVKLWTKRAEFETFSKVKSFLYFACRNACFDYLRSVRSHQVAYREIPYLSAEPESWRERKMAESLALQEIPSLVDTLPPRCQEVFRLLFFSNKKAPEVAILLGIGLSTVHTHKSAAIRKLRNALCSKYQLFRKYFPSSHNLPGAGGKDVPPVPGPVR